MNIHIIHTCHLGDLECNEIGYTFAQGSVFPNFNGTYLVDLSPDAGELRVYASESVKTPLQPARNTLADGGDSALPVVHLKLLPLQDSAMMTYPWRVNVTIRTNWTFGQVSNIIQYHPLASTTPRIFYPGKMISSGSWSLDGSEFFIMWMDGLISRIVVHPEVSASFVTSNSPLFKTHPQDIRIFRKLLHIRAFQALGSPDMLFLRI